jgi:hypothetical protein
MLWLKASTSHYAMKHQLSHRILKTAFTHALYAHFHEQFLEDVTKVFSSANLQAFLQKNLCNEMPSWYLGNCFQI